MILKSISIKNFRSIESLQAECSDVTIFYGSNDAGKSNILRALNLFFNDETDYKRRFDFRADFNVNTETPRRKAKEISVGLTLNIPAGYSRTEGQDTAFWRKVWRSSGLHSEKLTFGDGSEIPSRSRIPILMSRIKYSYIPAVKDREFFANLLGEVYSVLSEVAEESLRTSSAQFEREIQGYLTDLTTSIREALKTDSLVRLPRNLTSIFEGLEFNTQEGIPLSSRGDGIKARHIPMILRFLHQKKITIEGRGAIPQLQVWGFEEPENNIEMTACFDAAKQFLDFASDIQIFLTTHSPVFYALKGDVETAQVRVYRIRKNEKHTVGEDEPRSRADVDMGLMPLIAPYVAEKEQAIKEYRDALNQATEMGAAGLPAIFVEGVSDKIIYDRAIQLFFPRNADRLQVVAPPPGRGGYEFVKHRIIAWHYLQLHKRDQILRAAGIFDADPGGKTARRETLAALGAHNGTHVHVYVPRRPQTLTALAGRGYRIDTTLESLYPDEVWREAAERGWLTYRSDARTIDQERLIEALAERRDLFGGLSDDEKRRVTMVFKEENKVDCARFITRHGNARCEQLLAELRTDLDRWLRQLLGQDFGE